MNYLTSDFYCTQCGNRGIPIARKDNKIREPGHLKKLFCLKCGTYTNHVECRGFGRYTHEDFLIEFEKGNFNSKGTRINSNWKNFIAQYKGEIQ